MNLFLRFLLTLPLLVKSQNYREDMSSVMSSMRTLENYSMRQHYKLFLDDNIKTPFQEKSTLIIKHQEGIYYKQKGLEFMANKQYAVYLDKNSRTITALRKTAYETQEQQKESMFNEAKKIEDLLSQYDEVKVVSHITNKITYRLQLKNNTSIGHILVSMDLKKKVLLKVQYFYKEAMPISELKRSLHKAMLEISYEDIKIGTVSSSGLFNEKTYLAFNAGKIKPSETYKGYTLNFLN